LRWRPVCKAMPASRSARSPGRCSPAGHKVSCHLYVWTPKYHAGKLEPFAEVLLGGAHSNFHANACNKNTGECRISLRAKRSLPLQSAGAWISRSAARSRSGLVDADYELTRFGNNFTGGNNSQRNFRFRSRILEQPHYWPKYEVSGAPVASDSGQARPKAYICLASCLLRCQNLVRIVGMNGGTK
jgi:hypothetical protein